MRNSFTSPIVSPNLLLLVLFANTLCLLSAWAPTKSIQRLQTRQSNPTITILSSYDNKNGEIEPSHVLQDMSRFCQQAIGSAVLGGALIFCPFSLTSNTNSFLPAEAFAATVMAAPSQQRASDSLMETANVLEDANLPKPDAIGTVDSAENPTKIEPIFLPSETSETEKEEAIGVIDEAWTLVDKYYIDRSFGGQNWNQIREKYKFLASKKNNKDPQALVREMISLLGDKYTRILDPKQYAAIQKYDLIGVGVSLMPDKDQNIIVGAPAIAGSQADQAGLKQGDYITAINGVSTKGRNAFDIIDQISENPNAPTITMTVRPKGSTEETATKDIVMQRTFFEIKDPIRYKIAETRPDGTKVGFIKIVEFNSLVKGNLEKALNELEAAGVNAYVIDIRQNTGGAFQSAVEISGLFVDDRIATYVVDNSNAKVPFRTTKGKVLVDPEDPIVLWMDGRSASASEVFAGSLHDNCRAVLVGEKSFGKGLIQAVYGLKNGAGLVLTVARYVTPSGNDIQGVGITPDLGSQYLPATILPGTGTDTSKIDFANIRSRLSEKTCRIPDEL